MFFFCGFNPWSSSVLITAVQYMIRYIRSRYNDTWLYADVFVFIIHHFMLDFFYALQKFFKIASHWGIMILLFRVVWLVHGQWCDYPNASEGILKYMGKIERFTAATKHNKAQNKCRVHENNRTCRTFPMDRPKSLMRNFTNLHRMYEAHQTTKCLNEPWKFFGYTANV